MSLLSFNFSRGSLFLPLGLSFRVSSPLSTYQSLSLSACLPTSPPQPLSTVLHSCACSCFPSLIRPYSGHVADMSKASGQIGNPSCKQDSLIHHIIHCSHSHNASTKQSAPKMPIKEHRKEISRKYRNDSAPIGKFVRVYTSEISECVYYCVYKRKKRTT